VTGIVPTNAYPCLPDPTTGTPTYVVIGGNGDTIYNRLMHAISRSDLTGPAYERNQHRVINQTIIEDAISAWTKERTVDQVIERMNEAGVPVGRVVSVKEVVENEQFIARGAVRDVWVDASSGGKNGEKKGGGKGGWNVKMQGTFPVIDGVSSRPKWAGPDLGLHTDEILMNELGMGVEELDKLRAGGIIG
jgi:crotonobetainyl-CoA:carnitine CoA-transferase CaiB-like acyl-CoA transferase